MWTSWIQISFGANLDDGLGVFLSEACASQLIPFPDGDGHHPRLDFHVPAVAFADGESQRVVARTDTRLATHTSVPRFKGGGVDGRCAYARLKEYGVDADELQTV